MQHLSFWQRNATYLEVVLLCAVLISMTGLLFASMEWRSAEKQKELLEERIRFMEMRDLLDARPTHVVCECPAYEDGWDDAEVAEGCSPTEISISEEDLREMCSELEEYGYVPDC